MKFENTWIGNFKNAFMGMRNPLNSWEKSDSDFGIINLDYYDKEVEMAHKWINAKYPEVDLFSEEGIKLTENYSDWLNENGALNINPDENVAEVVLLGPNDMQLAQRLIKAGPEHRKFMRQIFVSVDITAPLYFFKEWDTYKISTTSNSTSTMHKLKDTPITLDCFETGDFNPDLQYFETNTTGMLSEIIIEQLEYLRLKYLETKDERYWKELVRWLPMSWLQTRTWTANYEVLYSMILQRGWHKLKTEWGDGFIKWCAALPYAKDLLFYGDNKREILYKFYTEEK